MKMTPGYQGLMGQFLFNGGMKTLFEMFCCVWLETCCSLLAFLFCFLYVCARCAHLWVHTHTHRDRIIPQGFSSVVSWQELKKE